MASGSSRTPSTFGHGASETGEQVYDDGFLRVEHENYYVGCGGTRLALSLKEFLLLSRLVRNAERVVHVDELWRFVWGIERPSDPGTLKVYICKLRRKLVPFGIQVESMIGVGYRICLRSPNEHDS